jgi:predicted RNA-binding Zn ribbon-like protein
MAAARLPDAGPTTAVARAAGFAIGDQPLAVELADTLVTGEARDVELLRDQKRCDMFWALQHARLPATWSRPTIEATKDLRTAIRALLDDRVDGLAPEPWAITAVNAAAGSASVAPQLAVDGDALEPRSAWLAERADALALSAAARSAIDLLTGPQAGRLRRCANPDCRVLFVAHDLRRKWCTPNICGNRARVARHYRRHHGAPS